MHLGAEPCDHRAVVPAVLAVRHEHLGSPGVRHLLDHVAEASVLGHSSSEEDLLLAYVRHGALRDLGQHRECGLLHRERDVLERNALALQRQSGVDHAGECHVHALDRVRELVVLAPLRGEPLQFGAGVESHPQIPPELVEHVPDADVLRLSEDPVPAFCEGYDLGVPAGSVQEGGIPAARQSASDLDMGDAVVDADDRYPPDAGERPGGGSRDPQARAEPGTHGEGDQVYVLRGHPRLVDRPAHHIGHDLRVVIGRLARMKTALRRAEHIQLVRQDVAVLVHDADA